MCGGCKQCLRDQGWSPEDFEEDEVRTHADEVRELLIECALLLDGDPRELPREYRDGLALRCRRYAEDLARPDDQKEGER